MMEETYIMIWKNSEIVFKYELASYKTGSTLSLIGSIIVIAGVLFLLYATFKKPELVCDAPTESVKK